MENQKQTKRKLKFTMLTLALLIVFAGTVFAAQCSDGIDNDLDGAIDYPADSGCSDIDDNSESIFFGYAHGCLSEGDNLYNVFGDITYHCSTTTCNVCVRMTEAGNYTTLPARCNNVPQCGFNGGGGGPGIDQLPPEMTFSSPNLNGIYSRKAVLLNFNTDEPATVKYRNLNRASQSWKNVCSGCSSYSNTRSFDEGFNNLTFRAKDGVGNEAFFNLAFYVDSKKPRITKTEPKDGFASGDFMAEFKEANPSSLLLHYGNSQSGVFERTINLNSECDDISGGKKRCEAGVDLALFYGEEIEYWFDLTDIAGENAQSTHRVLNVDATFPVINYLNYTWVSANKVEVVIGIDEDNFDEATYLNHNENRPREKKFCSRLTNGECKKKITLRPGMNSIDFMIYDDAGNSVAQSLEITL